MNGHTTPSSYQDRLEAFRRSDAERDALFAEITRSYEDLQAKYADQCDDLRDAIESRRMWQSRASLSERALTEHRQAAGSNPFALAILDGDGAIFQDSLYAMGKNGGADAAHQLHNELRNHLKETYPDCNTANWNLVVHVILNMQGLAAKLQACNIICNTNDLYDFGRAFGMAQPLFSFIDAGSGKERADYKVRETLRLFLPIQSCKHVFFGPCHDNGYLPALEPYKRDAGIASRLTLVETRPAEPGFIDLGFKRIRIPRVFRSDNLPGKPMNFAFPQPQTLPIRNNSDMNATTVDFVPKSKGSSPAPSTDSASSSSWATVGKSSSTPKNINIASKKQALRHHILLNVHDERVDVELPRTDPNAEHRFAERVKVRGKLCNNYHLGGHCVLGGYCDYNHDERLSPGEQLVLKHKARSLCCPGKLACKDVNCFLGHHCRYGNKCLHEACRFGNTHHMDLEPAKRRYEDGIEEWLPSYLENFRP